jgi:hypothetical protein
VGFLGVEDRLAAISAGCDPLDQLARVVDFELFRGELHDAVGRGPQPNNMGGRPAHDALMMFEVLILQALYNIDRRHRLIRRYAVMHAAANDGRQLPGILNPDAFASGVWADTAYRSQKNEAALKEAGRTSQIHFRCAPGRALKPAHAKANAARSKVRSGVEHVFAELRTGWDCSCAPSASNAPRPRSGWPTSPTT